MAPSRTVFVANLAFDVSEEQLANVFSEVGPVQSAEIKFDNQTGRPKGYAFVTFYDEATAISAIRNLRDTNVNGRTLRIELSNDDPASSRRRRDHGPPAPVNRDLTPPVHAPYRDEPNIDLYNLPQGQEVLPGEKATDVISRTLAAVTPGQMQEVMAGVKTLITSHPEQARQLLASQPQLAYALFQAMLLMKIVDPSILQRISPLPPAAPPTNFPPVSQAPTSFPPYPPTQSAPTYPAVPAQTYATAPATAQTSYPAATAQPSYGYPPVQQPTQPTQPALPAHLQTALASLPEDQRAMLTQVLQLTPDQINRLDAGQKATIMQLRQQFLGAAA
ncbi:hypothetical protein M231_06697 [Tremella mesenterica]|uniref:RRM domain-containing protein n=1 Tax=Tremella mesenterica TaxID=5217 RepID=A0A4Q1BBC0_TREME|nr:hypothetical protein M231_06697 [Tremella mesenterica]